MKRFFLIIAAGMLLAGAPAQAQGLSSILKGAASAASSATGSDASSILGTLSKVIYSYTGQKDGVDLPGNWSYTGPAIALGSDNALSNIAGNAVSATAESKVEGYLQKFGIKSGSIKFTFNEDLTFTCTVLGIPLGGKWNYQAEAGTINLQFGKTLKYLSMTGTVKNNAGGIEMLFEGNRFLSFIKTVMSVVGKQNSTVGAISSLAGNYNNMKIGFKLTKI